MSATPDERSVKYVRAEPHIVITSDVYLRRPGIRDPTDDAILVPGALVLTLSEAIAHLREHGHADTAAELEQQVPDPDAPGRLYMKVGPEDLGELAAAGNETMHVFQIQAVALVSGMRRARWISDLRCGKRYSWRAVAAECYRTWLARSWTPSNNQLMGIALCERAAKLLGDDPHVMPWNDV